MTTRINTWYINNRIYKLPDIYKLNFWTDISDFLIHTIPIIRSFFTKALRVQFTGAESNNKPFLEDFSIFEFINFEWLYGITDRKVNCIRAKINVKDLKSP